MKNIILVATLLFFSLTSCNAQVNSKKSDEKKDSIQPEVNISVNKEYDENGNLIRVDSMYTSFYSNIKSDSILEKQIFEKFKRNFDLNFKPIDSIFMKDSYMMDPFKEFDFYTDDFFENHFRFRQERMKDIFKEMDSLKNSFYKQKQLELKNNKM